VVKSLPEILAEQRAEVARYRMVAKGLTDQKLSMMPAVVGVLLTGSVARGDARNRLLR
jgi:hypothetical protein